MTAGGDIRLERLTALPDRAAALAALEDIFFASTTRTEFASPADRAAFLATWTGWFVAEAPRDIWMAVAADGLVVGYLTGCKDSAGSVELRGASRNTRSSPTISPPIPPISM